MSGNQSPLQPHDRASGARSTLPIAFLYRRTPRTTASRAPRLFNTAQSPTTPWVQTPSHGTISSPLSRDHTARLLDPSPSRASPGTPGPRGARVRGRLTVPLLGLPLLACITGASTHGTPRLEAGLTTGRPAGPPPTGRVSPLPTSEPKTGRKLALALTMQATHTRTALPLTLASLLARIRTPLPLICLRPPRPYQARTGMVQPPLRHHMRPSPPPIVSTLKIIIKFVPFPTLPTFPTLPAPAPPTRFRSAPSRTLRTSALPTTAPNR